LLDKEYTVREIAQAMGRGKTSISDEIRVGKVNGVYDPEKAQHKAYVKRKYAKYQGMKIIENPELRTFVESGLLDDQSPENIAGRVTHHEKHLSSLSKDIIYKFIRSPYGRKIEYKRKKQQTKNKQRAAQKKKLQDRTFIDKRPKIVAQMKRIGDIEADFILSGKGGRGVLLTVLDRKSRRPYIERILPVTIPNTHRAFQRIKKRFPEMKTITTDNDLLFQHHTELAQLLGVKMYFCHPYHSWEKGAVENLNRLIRKDIPKGSDLSKYSRYSIQKIEDKLSRRYYKCLHFLTPNEVLEKHRNTKNRRSQAN
jgi:transposase, IS30 family